MLSIVAVPFDAYQALASAADRWLLTCLARYTNRAGEAWPAMRALAKDAAMSLASVSRRLKAMHDRGVFQRERLPGGGRYRYTLAEPYRLRWSERVPRAQNRVPQAGTREALPEKHEKRFADRKVSFSEMPDERAKWDARLRGWRRSRFWLPQWGPKPGEAGCFAPSAG